MEPLLQLQAVREVSELADPERPTEVAQRRFDAARNRTEQYADLPQAKHIAARLRMPWREILRLAHEPSSTHNHRLGRRQTSTEQDWLTDEYIGFVLKLIARRLNTRTLTPTQYRTERRAMLVADRSRWLHGRQLRLPNDEQIRVAAGSWNQALKLARLDERPQRGDQGQGRYASSTVELLERCYKAHGTEPVAAELVIFARANRIPYSPDKDKTWRECVAAWKTIRRAQGLPVPDGPPPKRERPDYAHDVGAARPGEKQRRRQSWRDPDACVACVIRYLEQLGPDERSTKRGYDDWAAGQTDAPRSSTFDQHGGWAALREAAQAHMSKDMSGGADRIPAIGFRRMVL